MAGFQGRPPDTGPPGGPPGSNTVNNQRNAQSYADRARMNVRFDQRLKRNVLDIDVEKENTDDEMFLDQDRIAKLCSNIGMKIDTDVEGYQISYRGKYGKIAVWCKEGIDILKFCRHEIFQVCKGVNTKNIRPSGKPDVTVTFAGLDFNTPDTLVQEYISKFGGKLVSKGVIYAKHGEGPFKGKFNGDRKYQVDFTSATTSMGTYHYLDGERIRVFYRGNSKTCGRCHKCSTVCPGGGLARDCQEMGGERTDLIEHMKKLWEVIGFCPTSFVLPERMDSQDDSVNSLGGDQEVIEKLSFPRQVPPQIMSEEEKLKISTVRLTNFPLEVTEDDLVTFLKESVDISITKENLDIVRNARSTQVRLGPGPDISVIIKAAVPL